MTLLPSSDFGIRGHEGKLYSVATLCAHPRCDKVSVHVHHLWPRSFLRGQPYDWVLLPNGVLIGNRVGLCLEHHNQVTGEIGGYRAKISFSSGLFHWHDRLPDGGDQEWISLGPLSFQPPGAKHHETTLRPDNHVDSCPTCGHKKEKARKKLPARKTKTWALTVPDDAEIGSDVLDEWADAFALILGFEDASSRLRRYHAVATVLAWAIQHEDEFTADLKEASEA